MTLMRAQGEAFSLQELGLARAAQLDPVLETLELAAGRLNALDQAVVQGETQGDAARPDGRREIRWKAPLLRSSRNQPMDWDKAIRLMEGVQPTLNELHTALRTPGRDPGDDYSGSTVRNMIPLRSVAQRLHDCIQVELHRGNLAAAHADLLTLLRLVRLHEDGWTLVNQMIRTAILGLATDTVWDALQAPGWTDEQLQSLQSELEQIRIVPQLPRTWEVMRIGALMEMDQYLRDGPSSQAWRWQFLTGTKRPAAWIEYSAFILWRVAHSGRDRLLHLRSHQAQIDRLRALASGVPFVELPPPPQPEVNWWNRTPQANGLFPFSQIPNFVRAVETVLGNDTQRRLAIAAVALERHRLHHGQYPESLQALVPEVLDAVPHDPISGESLRYHRDTDRAFTLEAVGFGPRTGTDLSGLVWPRTAAPSESAQ